MTMFVEGQDPLNTPGAPAPERSPIGAPEAPPVYRAPDFVRETIPAAFNVANPVVSVYNAMTSQSADKEFDPNHNAMEAIKGTWGESQPELFMGSRNATETQSLLARGAKENKDRQTLAAAGFPGMVAAFGAGLLDPSLAIMPWGLGGDALRVAGKMAALGALQSSVSAGAMYASQVTAKPEDALKSVASGTLLMGVLGGAIGHLAPAERAAASADIDAARGNAPAPKAKDIPDGPFARAEPPTSPIIQTWDKGQEGQNKGYIQKHTGFAGEGGISASGSMGGPKSSMGESAEDIGTITAKDGTPLRVMKTANEIAVWAKGEDIRGPEPADDPAQPWILQSWKNEADPLRSSW